ncbi:response regulator transcription factor [Bacillus sp. 1P06AnD]|uniref:response regulator transcription factor n=1 Tax=Bacillus sp. 1P06AnD TaxID=3132208 RepID=UPI0039A19A36
MKLLLVEDDDLLSKFVARGLKKLGYAVDHAYDGEEALQLYEINNYDLMILDLNIPKIEGIEVLRTIRKTDLDFRILILSARDKVEEKINGLDSGCNDYLTKPFDFGELEARIRNLLRRRIRIEDTKLHCGNLSMDTAAKSVAYKNKIIELTKKEYSILEYLMYHQEKVVSPEELIEHVWDSDTDLFSNSFRFHIHSLRKKLANISGDDGYIVTLRGQGYRICDPAKNLL